MKTFKGKPITLFGEQIIKGDVGPDFKAVNYQMQEVKLSDFDNEYIVLNIVPSLDTTVCDLQTKTISEEIDRKSNLDIRVITISKDLPFAQRRWCELNEREDAVVLSDYLYGEFGTKYGVLINENGLLARGFIILDNKRRVIYEQFGVEMSQHLDFDSLLSFISTLPDK